MKLQLEHVNFITEQEADGLSGDNNNSEGEPVFILVTKESKIVR
jgi:hypothetical protein